MVRLPACALTDVESEQIVGDHERAAVGRQNEGLCEPLAVIYKKTNMTNEKL